MMPTQSRWSRAISHAIGRAAALLLCSLFAGILPAADAERQVTIYSDTLREAGISPNTDGIIQFLRSLQPSEERDEEVKKLIEDLGHPEFDRRESATQALLKTAGLFTSAVNEAANDPDPEIRWRANFVLKRSADDSAKLMLAAFKLLEHDKSTRGAAEILKVIRFCRYEYLLEAAQRALNATAATSDLPLLRQLLTSDSSQLRAIALTTLAHVEADAASDEIALLLSDHSENVRFAVAKALANMGDKRCLPALLNLLKSEQLQIRSRGILVLRAVTKHDAGYVAYEAPDKRQNAVKNWAKWIDTEGVNAELHFPLKTTRLARGSLNGNTLISTGTRGKVMELDATGKPIWTYASNAWSAEKLQNGNVLVASYSQKLVQEVDRGGNVVWEMKGPSAMTAKPLLNGNFLIADFSGKRVIEVDRKKNIVWSHTTPGECFDADRLANGNTIFGCPNALQEVTPDGKVVNSWKIEGRLNGFQALESGNVLVANYGKNEVVEFTREGDVVWRLEEAQPCDVFRLPNGHLLVSTSKRIVEFTMDKTEVRVLSEAGYGSARR